MARPKTFLIDKILDYGSFSNRPNSPRYNLCLKASLFMADNQISKLTEKIVPIISSAFMLALKMIKAIPSMRPVESDLFLRLERMRNQIWAI